LIIEIIKKFPQLLRLLFILEFSNTLPLLLITAICR